MSATSEATVRMANQIARNFEALGCVSAVAATADHINNFWDPRMKAMAFGLLKYSDSGFSSIAAKAIRQLAASHIPATKSPSEKGQKLDESGYSDAD